MGDRLVRLIQNPNMIMAVIRGIGYAYATLNTDVTKEQMLAVVGVFEPFFAALAYMFNVDPATANAAGMSVARIRDVANSEDVTLGVKGTGDGGTKE